MTEVGYQVRLDQRETENGHSRFSQNANRFRTMRIPELGWQHVITSGHGARSKTWGIAASALGTLLAYR
jgi:hypothetical protein